MGRFLFLNLPMCYNKSMLHTTPYYKALSEARRVTIDHKHLWVFGFFLAIFAQGPEIASLLQLAQELPGRIVLLSHAQALGIPQMLLSLIALPSMDPFLFWTGAALLFTVATLIIYAQVGVILGTERARRGKEVTLSAILTEGTNHFWAFLFTNVFFKVATLVALIAATVIGSAVVGFNIEEHLEFFVLTSLILGAFGHVVLSFLRRLTLLFIVHQRINVYTAARNSVELFAGNWLACLELAVILFLIQLVTLAGSLALALFLMTPYLLIAPLIPPVGAWLLAVGTLLVIITTLILATSWFATFELASWTALFDDLRSPTKRFSSWLARKLSISQI